MNNYEQQEKVQTPLRERKRKQCGYPILPENDLYQLSPEETAAINKIPDIKGRDEAQ